VPHCASCHCALCCRFHWFTCDAGDITDAKLEDREGSRQFEDEWKQYDRILRETGVLDKTVWLDTRGNHGISAVF